MSLPFVLLLFFFKELPPKFFSDIFIRLSLTNVIRNHESDYQRDDNN